MPGPTGATGPTGPTGADATINGVNALTIEEGDNVSLSQSGSTVTISAQANVVTSGAANVATSAWSSNSTYSAYPYRASVTVSGMTANHVPGVVFDPDDADYGKLAPVCDSYAGGVYIYASEIPGAVVHVLSVSGVMGD